MDIVGTLRVVLEGHVDGRWRAIYLGNQSDYFDTKEEALESLRRMICGSCYTAGVTEVEVVDLNLEEARPA
jgi:hypothetical protein